MLLNFCRRTQQRVRLALLSFLVASLLACYMLAFFHLESLVHVDELEGQHLEEWSVVRLCKQVLLKDQTWKEIVGKVLAEIKREGENENELEKFLLDLEKGKNIKLNDLKFPEHRNSRLLFYDRNEVSGPNVKMELIQHHFQDVLEQICFEYSSMRNSETGSYRNQLGNLEDKTFSNLLNSKLDSNPRRSSFVNSDEDVQVEMNAEHVEFLEAKLHERQRMREHLLGQSEGKLKEYRNKKKWSLNVHKRFRGEILPPWKIFHNRIARDSLYDNDFSEGTPLNQLLINMATFPITSVDEISGLGTQLKYIFNFEDGSRALFKPMRTARDVEESMDTYYMYEKERHTSEIAAFHLDRLLGFRRVPPASGRFIDMIDDLQVFLSPHSKKKFYLSPVGNQCFFGKCLYYCDPAHGVCGRGKILEGSLVAFLPNKTVADWSSLKNPWGRSYSKYNKTYWEREPDGSKVCSHVKLQSPFDEETYMLNLVDIHVFDFLIGNKDRHHFHFFEKFGNKSSFVLIDNGKGFGRYSHDVIDILAPLYQCCVIRFTTLRTLFTMHTSPEKKLSRLMKESLSRDVLPDILTPAHLRALDRRVRIILEQVYHCILLRGNADKVILDDDLASFFNAKEVSADS